MNLENLGESTYKIDLFFDDELLLSEAVLLRDALGSLWRVKLSKDKAKWRGTLREELLATEAQAINGSIAKGINEFGDKDSKPENFEGDYPKPNVALASFEVGKTGLKTVHDALIAHRDYTDMDMLYPRTIPFIRISEGVLADTLAAQIAGELPEVVEQNDAQNIGFS